jgi:hypothetical protein
MTEPKSEAADGDQGRRDSLDLDALAVSDRFRLFNFTRRDDHVAYLWVLRALDRLRAVHQVQAHSDDVAVALAELAKAYDDVPPIDVALLRERLDALAEDQMLHRLEDASRAGSLARYRNRQSVYQFSELGDREQVYRRLARLDTVLDDMSRRAAQFHLALGEIVRSADTSPDTFLKYKNALLTHMTDFMAELNWYLPRLSAAVADVDETRMLELAADADDRPFLSRADIADDWRRRWGALRAWFGRADSDTGTDHSNTTTTAESRAEGLRSATRSAVSGVIALLRQVTEAQRGGVNRSSQLRHLAEWVFAAPDEQAAHALASAAFNLRSAPRRRARRRRADLQPRDLAGRARRGHLRHPVPAGEGTDGRLAPRPKPSRSSSGCGRTGTPTACGCRST